MSFNDESNEIIEMPSMSPFDISGELYELTERIDDPGQKKLAVIFAPMCVPGSTIVYVGAAPGDGWKQTLDLFPLVSKVVAVDPRPLSGHVNDPRVSYLPEAITTCEQLLAASNAEEKNLVWDVRKDMTAENRNAIISEEIEQLNSILSDPRLYENYKTIQLKINQTCIQQYALPKGGNFYFQPFTLTRGVYELRYVYHGQGSESPSLFYPSSDKLINLK